MLDDSIGRCQNSSEQFSPGLISLRSPTFCCSGHWIPLPNGRRLLTLRDAASYITRLPKKEPDLPEWQTAIEVLLLVSRGGPTMMARIGVMRALNRHVERSLIPI